MWSCRIHLSEVIEHVNKTRRDKKDKKIIVFFMPEDARKRKCKCAFCNAPAQFNAVDNENISY